MSLDALIAPLSRAAIFRGLDADRVREIARRAERVIYRPGDFLIEDGCPADAAILVVTGTAVRVSGPNLAQRAEPVPAGSLLAEMAMLIETEHSSTIIARSPVRALRMLRADILDLMTEDSGLADHFVAIIAGRLMTLAGQLRDIDAELAGSPEPLALAPPRARGSRDAPAARVH